MRLKPEEAVMFYEIFLPLLDYVNENHHVIMEPIHFAGESVDPRDAAEAAHFLWEHNECIDDYIAETALPEEHREDLSSWKRRVSGTFMIERHLKKGSVFVSVDNHSVYLVNGIIDSWAEMFSDMPLPIIVKATLLPFRKVIISDGLVSTSPIRFGRNIAMDLKNTYLTAKQQRKIMTHL